MADNKSLKEISESQHSSHINSQSFSQLASIGRNLINRKIDHKYNSASEGDDLEFLLDSEPETIKVLKPLNSEKTMIVPTIDESSNQEVSNQEFSDTTVFEILSGDNLPSLSISESNQTPQISNIDFLDTFTDKGLWVDDMSEDKDISTLFGDYSSGFDTAENIKVLQDSLYVEGKDFAASAAASSILIIPEYDGDIDKKSGKTFSSSSSSSKSVFLGDDTNHQGVISAASASTRVISVDDNTSKEVLDIGLTIDLDNSFSASLVDDISYLGVNNPDINDKGSNQIYPHFGYEDLGESLIFNNNYFNHSTG